MNVLSFAVVVVLILLVISTVSKMIVEMLATFEGVLSFFLFCAALIGLLLASGNF